MRLGSPSSSSSALASAARALGSTSAGAMSVENGSEV